MNSRALFSVAGLAATAALAYSTLAQTQNAEFVIETVKERVDRPWSLNFAPDGRLLFTGRNTTSVYSVDVKSGDLKTLGKVPDVRVEGEGGLLGMELSADFAKDKTLYLCYSYYKGNAVSDANKRNRLSSFVLTANGLTSEKALIDDMPGWWNHNGCRVVRSPDDKFLYVSMGDAAGQTPGPQRAQNPNDLGGKVFRIRPDGGIPNDNPFFAANTGAARAVWSIGHRNAQGLAFHPATGQLWSTEHGPEVKDELNVIKKGRNYGWPGCVGSDPCGVANYEPAVKAYDTNNTVAMSDMAFYTGSAFPAWKNNLLFVTLKTGRLYQLELDGERIKSERLLVDGDYGRLRDVTVGPDGFVYFSTDNGLSSSILRIRPK